MTIKNSIERCPNCGGSDVTLNQKLGKLQCRYCRSVFEPELGNERDNVLLLKGKIVGKGAEKIIDEKVMVTLKCSACGSEVSVNTSEALTARCPWCRNTLSINDKLPNGAVPDMILPFKLSRRAAHRLMNKFVQDHRTLCKQEFADQFSEDNLMGVYLPYMVVDMNVHAEMAGVGEHQTRRYMVGSGDDAEWRYDADIYNVGRKFELIVDDLTIEASADKLNQDISVNTNNIVSAIMPFDTQNAVKWDARYTTGFAFEKRDVDIKELDKLVKLQVEDIMRYRMRDWISFYDRGVRWDRMQLEQKGVKWKTAYLPVWLYSYLDKKKDGSAVLHYVAVNGRTGELVGSVPVEKNKVWHWVGVVPTVCVGMAIALKIISLAIDGFISLSYLQMLLSIVAFFWALIAGVIVAVKSNEYKNKTARHMHEKDTAAAIKNVVEEDFYASAVHGSRYSQMYDRNDYKIKGIRTRNGRVQVRDNQSSNPLMIIIIFMIAMFVFPIVFFIFILMLI